MKKEIFSGANLLPIRFSIETEKLFKKALDTFSAETLNLYREQTITSTKLGIQSRRLNNWDDKKIIVDTRDGAKSGWRRFSVFEWAHVEIVRVLREELDLATGPLANLRKSMEEKVYSGLTLLEVAFILTRGKTNGNIYLLINREGKSNISRKRDIIPMTAGMKSLELHIEINLNQLWKAKFGANIWDESVFMLNQDEIDLLKYADDPIIKKRIAEIEEVQYGSES
ncbi:MAG: hypothetical protein PHI50_01825 [Alphaproteobacteria bacterium]|nr:hypothetical protein [Alphaproteobacteria bacterium]